MARHNLQAWLLGTLACIPLALSRPLMHDGTRLLTRAIASITTLNTKEIEGIAPFAQFARASFCSPAVVSQWKCGPACDAAPDTQVLLSGGDDGAIPDFYVAFSPKSKSVIIAHQGTVFKNFTSVLNDIDIFFDEPSEEQFPGAKAKGGKVHGGFLKTFNRTANDVLAAVQKGVKVNGATNVKIVGHSLGAAISLFDAIHIRSSLDPNISMQTVLFGLPRVGNQEFADYIDGKNISLTYVVNDIDPVPMIPPTFLGYRHPSGQVYQTGDSSVVRCPGQENPKCSASTSLLTSEFSRHDGPYSGVPLGNKSCLL